MWAAPLSEGDGSHGPAPRDVSSIHDAVGASRPDSQRPALPQPPAAPGASPVPSAIFLSEGEQIRLGIGLLSIVWFAFFFVADARIPQAEHRAEVAYLVASASLGLVWSGPLTVLAGMRLYPRTYTLWQPFYGGFVFVLLQAFGWLLYAGSLMFCLLTLANLTSGHWHRGAHVEGGFVALGVLGLAAGIVLNMSLDYFDENLSASAVAAAAAAAAAAVDADATRSSRRPSSSPSRPSAMEVLFNGKTLVALLLSLVGLLLFLVCDAYRESLSPAALPIASLPFVGAAIVTQCINGPSQLKGYFPFQPFCGGMSFVLLQASGWFTFGGAVQAVLLVPTDRLGEMSGIIPLCGFTGLASQLILLSSLPHYEHGAGHCGGKGGRARKPRRTPSSEAFLSFCFYGWAAIVFIGAFALERGMLSSWALPINTRGLCLVSTLLLAVATPSAHLAGKRLHEAGGYRAWQPFCGGTMFCVAQGFGWLLYGAFTLLLLIPLRRPRTPSGSSMSEVLVFCVGSLAYAMIAFSLEHYDGRFAAARPAGSAAAGSEQQRAGGRWSVAWTGEIKASVTMAAVALGMCALVDAADSNLLPAFIGQAAAEWLSPFDPDDVTAMTALLLASVTALFGIAAGLMHFGASRRLRNYRLWMPFQGGDGFVVRQALGWTLLAMSQVLLWILVLMRVEGVQAEGALCLAGLASALAQLLLLRSLDFFAKEQVTVKLSGLADPALTVARLGDEIQLLQRLLCSADQPLVSRMLQSILTQLEERAAEASSHGAAARPLNVLLSPRAMQLLNFCLILVSMGGLLLADALRSTQPQVAQVLLATGVGLACYTIAFSHLFLGRLFHPSYRAFQPFVGSRYYVLLQAVGWSLFGIALVAAVTILYAPIHNVTLDGVVATVGVVLFLAQLLIAISVFAFKPPSELAARAPGAVGAGGAAAARRRRAAGKGGAAGACAPAAAAAAPGEWRAAGGFIQATHGQAIALLMSLSALVLFVIADLAPARLGSDGVLIGVPTAPIIGCALVALCGSVAVTYLISCTQMPCGVAIDVGQRAVERLAEQPRAPRGHAVPGFAHARSPTLAASSPARAASAARSMPPPLSLPPLQQPSLPSCAALSSPASASDVTVVLAGRGRFLVSHIFGCALLSLTFLRAALGGLHRELQAPGQHTLTGLAGLASILLMLCSQSAGGARPVPSGGDALTIRLDAFPGQLCSALWGARAVDGRAARCYARAVMWRLLLSLRPLSVAAALVATLAVRERRGVGVPFAPPDGAQAAMSAMLGNCSLGGSLGGGGGDGNAFLRGGLGACAGAGALDCHAPPLLLAAARAAPRHVTLGAALAQLVSHLGRALSPGRAVLLGTALTAAALLARLLLSARQGERINAAAEHQRAADTAAAQAGTFWLDGSADEDAPPAAASAAVAPSATSSGLALSLCRLPRRDLARASASLIAHGLQRLRTSLPCSAAASAAELGAGTPSAQLGVRVLALLRSVEGALSGQDERALATSSGGALSTGASTSDERRASAAAPGALSAIERLSAEELQDTLGSVLPAQQLAALSRCSSTLHARLPPLFWRLRFVQQHGKSLGMQPHRMTVPSLRACAAADSSPFCALLESALAPARSLLDVVRSAADCAAARAGFAPAAQAGAAARQQRALMPAAVEGLHWRRACTLAERGAQLRYCAVCCHIDLDADVCCATPPSPRRSSSAAAAAAAAAAAGSTRGAWVVLPRCPAHSEIGGGSCEALGGGETARPPWACAAFEGPTVTVTAHRACLERVAAAREGRACATSFYCPRCAQRLPTGERPVRTWTELIATANAHDARSYARRSLLLIAASLLVLWGLQAACALAEMRERQQAALVGSTQKEAPCSQLLAAALRATVPHLRLVLFCVHAGCLLELLASRHAWSAVASARSASEHAAHVAIAAIICVCAAVELAEHSALRLHSLHPLFALSVPHSLAHLLCALCSVLFFASSQAVLLKAWCARSVVCTPRSLGFCGSQLTADAVASPDQRV